MNVRPLGLCGLRWLTFGSDFGLVCGKVSIFFPGNNSYYQGIHEHIYTLPVGMSHNINSELVPQGLIETQRGFGWGWLILWGWGTNPDERESHMGTYGSFILSWFYLWTALGPWKHIRSSAGSVFIPLVTHIRDFSVLHVVYSDISSLLTEVNVSCVMCHFMTTGFVCSYSN